MVTLTMLRRLALPLVLWGGGIALLISLRGEVLWHALLELLLSPLTLVGMMLAAGALWCCRAQAAPRGSRCCLVVAALLALLNGLVVVWLLLVGDTIGWLVATTLNSTLALLLTAAALLLRQWSARYAALSVQLVAYLVAMLALYDMAPLWGGLDLLLSWGPHIRTNPVSGSVLLLMALALLVMPPHSMVSSEQRVGITAASLAVVLFTSLFVALVVAGIAARHIFDAGQRDMEHLVHERGRLLQQTLRWREEELSQLAQRMSLQMQRRPATAFDVEQMMALLAQTTDFHDLQLLATDGHLLAGFGQQADGGSFALPLAEGKGALYWGALPLLQARAPVGLPDQQVGMLQARMPLHLFSTTLLDTTGLGQSGELLVCGSSEAARLICLPSRNRQAPVGMEAEAAPEFPIIARALAGEQGATVLHLNDDAPRLFNYGRLAETGLVVVMSRRLDELYPSLLRDLVAIPLMWAVLALLGIWLLRLQVRPLLQKLHKSERHYRTLVESSPDWIWEVDDGGRYTYASGTVQAMLGYRPEALIGRTPFELMPEEEAVRVGKLFGEIVARREPFHGLRNVNRHRDGHLVVLETSGVPILGERGELLGYRGSDRDVSALERTAEALRRSEQLHRSVVETLAEGVVVTDMTGRVVAVNSAAQAIFGRAANDIEGRDFLDPVWASIREDGTPLPGESHPVMVSLRSGESLRGVVMGVKQGDGSRAWISVSSDLLRDEVTGEVLGVVASLQDITARRAAEAEVLASRERLRSLTSHLQVVLEQEKIAVARELHDELGGTLAALKMDMAWLQQELPVAGTQQQKLAGMLSLLDTAVVAVRRIVSELRPTVLDDLGLWAALEWQVRQFEQRSGIRCRLRLDCEMVQLIPQQSLALFRVAQESLTNIGKHADATAVEVDCWHDGELLQLSIHDNGIGMNDALLLATNSHGIRGMQERLAEVGGLLQIHSAPGDGTMVLIVLPARREERQP